MLGKKSSDYVPPATLPGRNDACHCGSGKKYKKCCETKDDAARHTVLEKQWTEAEKAAKKKADEEKEKTPEQQAISHKPTSPTNVSGQKHNTMTVPKFNMPRRTGGG